MNDSINLGINKISVNWTRRYPKNGAIVEATRVSKTYTLETLIEATRLKINDKPLHLWTRRYFQRWEQTNSLLSLPSLYLGCGCTSSLYGSPDYQACDQLCWNSQMFAVHWTIKQYIEKFMIYSTSLQYFKQHRIKMKTTWSKLSTVSMQSTYSLFQ